MEHAREHLYLAALLHDVGKFYQRADVPLASKKSYLSEYSAEMAIDSSSSHNTEQSSHQHVIWTSEFFYKFRAVFEEMPDLKSHLFSNGDSLINLACHYNNPNSPLEAIVAMADSWSAGTGRHEMTESEGGIVKGDSFDWGTDRHKKIPLFSVFNEIYDKHFTSAFSLSPLSLNEDSFFPKNIQKSEDGNSESEYKALWESFEAELLKLPLDSFDGFSESLLFLLKKYAWCIPSSALRISNVSLFDHLKTTAAFADCLYQYWVFHPEAFTWEDKNSKLVLSEEHRPVILLGCDISGIQNFIYNIASRKASVSLKGRSFYLQLLVDSIIQRIISHPDVNAKLAHVVYSSGGKFYMILPNVKVVLDAIHTLKNEIEEELWGEHSGLLSVNLDYVPFTYGMDFKQIYYESDYNKIDKGNLGDLWKCLADKLTICRRHKFRDVLLKQYDNLFSPIPCGGEATVCSVTGIESNDCVVLDTSSYVGNDSHADDFDKPTYVLPIVGQQSTLGAALKDANYILTSSSSINKLSADSNSKKRTLSILHIHNYLLSKKALSDAETNFLTIPSTDMCRVNAINDMNFLATQIKGQKIAYGFQYYGGNKQAQTDEGKLKTFDELAGESYLGVLRMDVDNLGSLFVNGLPQRDKTFAAYSTLSFMLDRFFSGYLNTIREDYKNDVNIIYSGGDDVFAVGRWDQLILFAEKVQNCFKRFIGRDDITISAGIIIVGKKYPLAKAAELSGDAEDLAKQFRGKEKNAINLFGQNISWDKEFDYVKSWMNRFVELCSDPYPMPKSILHKLMLFAEIIQTNNRIKNGLEWDVEKKEDFSYCWNTVYFLARFKEPYESKQNKGEKDRLIIDLCNELNRELLTIRCYELIAIAARWAELNLKK